MKNRDSANQKQGTSRLDIVSRVQVGSNVITGRFPTQLPQCSLERDYPARGNLAPVYPHRNLGLANMLPGDGFQFSGDPGLPARFADLSLNGLNGHTHGGHNNTVSVFCANTPGVMGIPHNPDMTRDTTTSDFWLRLIRARTECNPPLSPKQKHVGADFKVGQSAVTKWKTGKGLPEPHVVRDMAMRYNVNFEWLYTGRGEMRPGKTYDAITHSIIEGLERLQPNNKLNVLKSVLLEQTLQHPAIAAHIRAAEKNIETMVKKNQKRPGQSG